MEEEIRKAAIRRFILQGESPKAIYISLNRSKQWFYKWLKRYHTQGKEWYKDRDSRHTGKKGVYRCLNGMGPVPATMYGIE